ncbi:MAG: IclR family transcriptional regulator [Rubrivivax sp.]
MLELGCIDAPLPAGTLAGSPPRTAPPFDAAEERHRGTHTLERALSILKAFDGHKAALSNSQLVQRTGFSKASVSRITATLLGLGYLARDNDGVRFRIGMRGRMLGHTYRTNSPLSALARPWMQAFADRHDLSIALGTGDGTDMLYLEYCKSPRTATLCFAVGGRIPMELTAMGRAYLWDQAPAERRELLERIAASPRPGRARALARIDAAFGQLSADGFCVASGEYQRDSYGIAIALRLGRPELRMSLNCSGMLPAPDERQIREVVVPGLQDTARQLQEAFAGVDSRLF